MLLFNSKKDKKIKINLEYNSDTFEVSLEPYQTIRHLREMSSKVFHPLFPPKLIYCNKDISEDESMILGDIFKNISTIIIVKIQPPIGFKDKHVPFNSNLRYKPSPIENSKTNFNNKKATIFRYIDNSLSGKVKHTSSITSISSTSTSNNSEDKSFCKCGKGVLFYYCLTCFDYYCNYCNTQHFSHKNIRIDTTNIGESIKIYSMSLQAELSKTFQQMNNCVNLIQNSVFIDRQSRKEMIQRKLDDIEKLYEERIVKIEKDNMEKTFDNLESRSKVINQEIEKIVDELTYNMLNSRRGLNKSKAKEYLDFINGKDKIIQSIVEHVETYNEYYENCKRVDEMFNNLDSIIDKVQLEFNLLNRKIGNKENLEKNENNYNLFPSIKNPMENKEKINILAIERLIPTIKNDNLKLVSERNIYSTGDISTPTMRNRSHMDNMDRGFSSSINNSSLNYSKGFFKNMNDQTDSKTHSTKLINKVIDLRQSIGRTMELKFDNLFEKIF